jgi:hypothetical protein
MRYSSARASAGARAGIEAAVEARLHEGIEVPSDVRVEEEREAGIREEALVSEDQPGRSLVDVVAFEVEPPAELRPDEAARRLHGQGPVDSIQRLGPRPDRGDARDLHEDQQCGETPSRDGP